MEEIIFDLHNALPDGEALKIEFRDTEPDEYSYVVVVKNFEKFGIHLSGSSHSIYDTFKVLHQEFKRHEQRIHEVESLLEQPDVQRYIELTGGRK